MRKLRPASANSFGLLCVALFTTLVACTNARGNGSPKFDTELLTVSSPCLDRCRINGSDVDCTRAQCKTIPANISDKTTRLIMAENPMTVLTFSSFATLPKLEYLDLSHCDTRTIGPGAFRLLTKLEVLNLSYNRRLKNVAIDSFSSLVSLRVLNLTASRLRRKYIFNSGYLLNLTNLRGLYLGQNQLPKFPRFIDFKNKALLPRIEVLHLEDNNIEQLEQTELLGLESLKELILNGNRLRSIKNNTFLGLPHLLFLNLNKNVNLVPEKLSFASFSLRRLSLRDVAPKRYNLSGGIFEGMPNLVRLSLANSRRIYKAALPFSSLSNLVRLSLRGVRVRAGGLRNITENLSKLRRLDLSDNEISHLNASLFRNLQLDVLLLRRNWISTITKTTLSHGMWSRLKEADFSENPFFCDCRIVWFRQWLRNTTRVTVVRNIDRMVCIGPAEAKNAKLYRMTRPTKEECFTEDNDYYLLSVFLVTLAIWFLAPFMSLIHRYRWFLKYYYFKYKVSGDKFFKRICFITQFITSG